MLSLVELTLNSYFILHSSPMLHVSSPSIETEESVFESNYAGVS